MKPIMPSVNVPKDEEDVVIKKPTPRKVVTEKPFSAIERVAASWHLEIVDGKLKAYNKRSKRTFTGTKKQFDDLFKG